MVEAIIEGPLECSKGLPHEFGIAIVAVGVPLLTIATALGHANLQITAVYITAADLEARDFLTRMCRKKICGIRRVKISGEGP